MALPIPKVDSYGIYRTGSYGRINTLCLTIGAIKIYYSYSTPVAFVNNEGTLIIRKNDWSVTTGTHLNWIDPDKAKRIDGDVFETLLERHMALYGLISDSSGLPSAIDDGSTKVDSGS